MKYTPIFQFPYVEATDYARDYPGTTKRMVESIEAALLDNGQPPVGSDVQSLLARLNTAEGKLAAAEAKLKTVQLITSRATLVNVGGATFSVIGPGSALVDSAKGYSESTGKYTIPAGMGGVWQITAALRFTDSQLASGTNVAIGVDTKVADGPNVYWYTAGGNRNSFVYTRTAQFAAGDVVSLFTYLDKSGTTTNSQVAYSLLRPAQ